MSMFKPATKTQSKLRMALIGPSGSGKTFTALSIAKHLGDRIAVIDTERGSASKYSGPDLFQFDVLELDSFNPTTYISGINGAVAAGYDVLIIDSLSHAWMGKDGVLEFVDKAAARSKSGSSFGVWRDATPLHNSLVDAILGARIHIIATMRAKTEYVQEKDERGKTVIRKVGLQPVQREGLDYEFDVIADLDQDNNFIVTKTRFHTLNGYVEKQAGEKVAGIIRDWLTDGAPLPPPAEPMSTQRQWTALGIAMRTLQFGDDDEGKQRARGFFSWLAGLDAPVDSVKDFTEAQASQAMQRIGGSGSDGRYVVDEVLLQDALAAWHEHLDFQRSVEAAGEPVASPEPARDVPAFDPNTRPGKRSKKTMADPIERDETADLREEVPVAEQQGALL